MVREDKSSMASPSSSLSPLILATDNRQLLILATDNGQLLILATDNRQPSAGCHKQDKCISAKSGSLKPSLPKVSPGTIYVDWRVQIIYTEDGTCHENTNILESLNNLKRIVNKSKTHNNGAQQFHCKTHWCNTSLFFCGESQFKNVEAAKVTSLSEECWLSGHRGQKI